ncbi:MAG: REP-associated tyrosine transposase [Thermodesulfobacteriota bacterium]
MPFPKTKEKSGGPVTSFQTHRRNLPHWQQPGSIYFITWRLKREEILSAEEKTIILKSLLYWDEAKWIVHAAVVMPDHVHVIAQPLFLPDGSAVNLSEIIRSVKTFSARTINAQRGIRGTLWQDERYDRIIRDEEELLEKWQYLRQNPVERGLASNPEDYPWLYEKN